MTNIELINKLKDEKQLSHKEFEQIISTYTPDDLAHAQTHALEISQRIFGRKIYFRGIVEFSNICKNDCYYCGIRKSNACAQRYRLEKQDILACCREGYENGFRTFVLQGGEDGYFSDDRMCDIVSSIKEEYPDCAITLSLGERSYDSYKKLFDAGANRYLLRHETANEEHYSLIHPKELSLKNRIRCLYDLKDIGYQVGCGCMVGTPFQTASHLADDMVFMQKFDPAMVGIGPFIPHKDTPFGDAPSGSVNTTLLMMALCRIMLPNVMMPATTALGTADQDGRKLGVLFGCNVVMPNLSPMSVRKKYMLYNDKAGTEISAKEGIALLRSQMEEIGYEVIIGRGDYKKEEA
ncbi:MAG: [FeFe] hydrogenase H-cluster radical SAM maturase HydE [Clostridiales bacterium]|nr:[FeFe] hydrogenase H-cluster radical SAM maturase HydE [Clostridiales bacterium]